MRCLLFVKSFWGWMLDEFWHFFYFNFGFLLALCSMFVRDRFVDSFWDGIFMILGSKMMPNGTRGLRQRRSFYLTFPNLFPRGCFWRFLGSLWHPLGSILVCLAPSIFASFSIILVSFSIAFSILFDPAL